MIYMFILLFSPLQIIPCIACVSTLYASNLKPHINSMNNLYYYLLSNYQFLLSEYIALAWKLPWVRSINNVIFLIAFHFVNVGNLCTLGDLISESDSMTLLSNFNRISTAVSAKVYLWIKYIVKWGWWKLPKLSPDLSFTSAS